MGGEPYTWRRVRTVRRQAVGNLHRKVAWRRQPSLQITAQKKSQDMEQLSEKLGDMEKSICRSI